jgi:hypothetical protein
MMPIDFAVVALAVVSIFYLPFAGARLLTWLVFDRREPSVGLADLDLALAHGPVSQPHWITVGGPPVPSPSSSEVLDVGVLDLEVLDVRGLLQYLLDERAGEAEALLSEILLQGSPPPPRP